jgi:MarR family transcriptional regulator, organic hydroperoxide resistance regulator
MGHTAKPQRTKAPPVSGRPAELSRLVSELLAHVHRRSAGDSLAIMSEAGLTMPQLVTLHMLAHAGARSVGTIAGCLRLSAPATSHLVDRLVKAKLVVRAEDPADRRQKSLAITAGGRALIERINSERSREVSVVLARLSAALRRQFAEVLARVIEELAGLPARDSGETRAQKESR